MADGSFSGFGFDTPSTFGGGDFGDAFNPPNFQLPNFDFGLGDTQQPSLFSPFDPTQRPFGSAPAPTLPADFINTGNTTINPANQGTDWRSLLGLTGPNAGLNAGALGLTGLGLGMGVIGMIQKLAQGAPVTRQEVQRTVQQASPQEQALLQQLLGNLSQMQGLASNAQLQQAVSRLASGQLPISPDLVSSVTKAYSAEAGSAAEQAIQNARERGFAGGVDLLGGAGGPAFGLSMSNLNSDINKALVNLALGLPQAASNINAQQVGAMNTAGQGQLGLLDTLANQRFAGAGTTSRTTQPRPTLLDVLSPFANTLGGFGGALGGLTAFQQAQQPRITPIFNFAGTPNAGSQA